MSRLRVMLARLRGQFAQRRLDRELDEELRFHLEMQAADNVESGMTPEVAQAAARRSLGTLTLVREQHRELRGFALVGRVAQDVRYASRLLVQSPSFAVAAIVTLATAMAATTVMLSVVNAVLLRPLPFRRPEELVMVWLSGIHQGSEGRPPFVAVEAWRKSGAFADLAVLDPISASLAGAQGLERISVARISPNLFPLLGVQPVIGRLFTTEEAERRERLTVVSHRFWRARFGSDLSVLGATIDLDGQRSRIVGVLPDRAAIPGLDADVWEAHTLFPDWEQRRTQLSGGSWFVLGRLQTGVSIEQARTQANVLVPGLRLAESPDIQAGVSVVALSRQVVGSRAQQALGLLAGAVICVLLVAAANVASLVLVRDAGRGRELTLRSTLGASRARIAQQLVAENLTLATVAAAAGLGLALVGNRMVRILGPTDLARLGETTIDARVFGWTMAMTLSAGAFIGGLPAATLQRSWAEATSGAEARSVGGGRSARNVRRILVVGELALAIVLTSSAGLLIRSWWDVTRLDAGFKSARVLSVQLAAPVHVAEAQRAGFYQGLLAEVAAAPGIEEVGIVGDLFVGHEGEREISVEGRSGSRVSAQISARLDEASERLFTTLQIPLVSGRFFTADDRAGAMPVAIINQALARRFWADADPVGGRLKFGAPSSSRPWLTVIGVVGDMRRQGLEVEPVAQIFQPLAQSPSRLETLVVRGRAADPLELLPKVREAVWRVDRQTLLYDAARVDDRLGASLGQRRFQTLLLAAFSCIALLMAAIGIYGLIHYSVSARRQEIAVRLAIGARSTDVVWLVATECAQLITAGIGLGLLGAWLAGRVGEGLLVGVSGSDPLALGVASVSLLAVTVAACYFPVRRALRIEPNVALRHA